MTLVMVPSYCLRNQKNLSPTSSTRFQGMILVFLRILEDSVHLPFVFTASDVWVVNISGEG